MGMFNSGDQDLRRLIGARQTSHDWYTGGMDHYNGPVDNGHEWKQAASRWVNARNGGPTISPWINTFDHASELAYNRMRMDNYNPFLGREGGWVGDENFALTGNSEGYRDDSIAGWFKQAFSGSDMVKHRRNAIRGLNNFVGGSGDYGNKATTRMTKELFDQMNLAEQYGLEWGDVEQSRNDEQILRDIIAKGNALIGGGSAGLMRNAAEPQGEGSVWTDLDTNVAGQNMGPFMLGQIAKRR